MENGRNTECTPKWLLSPSACVWYKIGIIYKVRLKQHWQWKWISLWGLSRLMFATRVAAHTIRFTCKRSSESKEEWCVYISRPFGHRRSLDAVQWFSFSISLYGPIKRADSSLITSVVRGIFFNCVAASFLRRISRSQAWIISSRRRNNSKNKQANIWKTKASP